MRVNKKRLFLQIIQKYKMINKIKLYPIESLLVTLIAVYSVAIFCFYIFGPLDIDIAIDIYVDGLIAPLILTGVLLAVWVASQKTSLANIFLEKAPQMRGYVSKVSLLLIALNVGVIAIYTYSGPFKVDIPVATVKVPDTEKPYLVLFLAVTVLLVFILYRMAPPDTILDEVDKSSFEISPRLTSWVLLIIVLGGLLRVWGLSQGIEDNFLHPDAAKQLWAIKRYLNGDYLFDLDYYRVDRFVAGYPYFGMHIGEMALRVISITGYDTFDDSEIIMTYRLLNVAYSCAMIALVYKTGALLGYKRAGLLGAGLLAFSTTHNHMCKYLGADISMSFFALLAVYVATMILKWERNRYYLYFGVAAGLSAACKYNGVLIFFVLGFAFLTLHTRFGDILRNTPRLVMSVLVSILTFVFVNANILSSPVKAIDAIRETMNLSSYYWVEDHSFSGKLNSLMNYDYNVFVIDGLFKPVPLWLAILALLVLIYKYPRKLAYLWIAPAVIFVAGKLSMPVSASHHYMNIVPLLMLAIAVGVDETAKMVGKRFGAILPIVLLLYVSYHAIQDNSFWLLKSVYAQGRSWTIDNISPANKARGMVKTISSYEAPTGIGGKGHRVRYFYNIMNEMAVSIHRDSHIEIFIDSKNSPLMYPPVHFVANDSRNTIYPASHDVVTTDKAFVTGYIFQYKPSITKFVMAEIPLARIAIWIKNFSDKKNKVTLRVGGKNFKYELGPFEVAPLTIVDNPKRTFLYYHSLVKIDAESEELAGWRVAVNESDVGDLYLALGETDLAADAYLKSGNLYSVMRALVNTSLREKRAEAVAQVKALKPAILESNIFVADENLWESIAGYTDEMFRSVMTRPVEYDSRFTKNAKRLDRYVDGEVTESTWEIGEGGQIYGPYVPLLGGFYKISAEIMARGNLDSLTFDVSSSFGRKLIRSWEFKGNQLPSSLSYKKVTFEFEIKSPLEAPVEFRFHQVKGGSVLIKKVDISADYLSQTKELLLKTEEILKNPRSQK